MDPSTVYVVAGLAAVIAGALYFSRPKPRVVEVPEIVIKPAVVVVQAPAVLTHENAVLVAKSAAKSKPKATSKRSRRRERKP